MQLQVQANNKPMIDGWLFLKSCLKIIRKENSNAGQWRKFQKSSMSVEITLAKCGKAWMNPLKIDILIWMSDCARKIVAIKGKISIWIKL